MDLIKKFRVTKDGYAQIAVFLLVTILAYAVVTFLGHISLIATCWCVYFFRDPARIVPQGDDLIVSPADGMVCAIVEEKAPEELELGNEVFTRVSVFLNIFDVHVNRAPIAGKVMKLRYHPGKFFNASLDKASKDNERQSVLIETTNGKIFPVVQIAGLVARRIVCNISEDQHLKTGERFGMIKFGSRVDVYLPKGIAPLVVVGQRAVAGETILASTSGEQVQRKGEEI